MNLAGRLAAGFKALSIFRSDAAPAVPRSLYTPSYLVDPDRTEIWENSAVAACLSTALDAYIEAAPCLWEMVGSDDDGEPVWEKRPEHPISRLLDEPNPYYTGAELRQATLLSRLCDGNGYNVIVEDGYGRPAELWYEPHYNIEPYWDQVSQSSYIDGYRRGDGSTVPIHNVVHFRSGLDPMNTRKGLASLKAALRRVKADDEIDAYTYAVVRNKGVVGLMVSPKHPDDEFIEETRAEIEERIASKLGGDRRGSTLVMSRAVDIQSPSMSPKDLDISDMSRTSEERISGILNTPAILAGLGAGLDRSTFANMEEAQRYFSQRFLVPKWRMEGVVYGRILLPRFGLDRERFRIAVDTRQVVALQDDREQLHKIADGSFSAGWIDRYEAKRLAGLRPTPDDRGVYHSSGIGGQSEAQKQFKVALAEKWRRRADQQHDDIG